MTRAWNRLKIIRLVGAVEYDRMRSGVENQSSRYFRRCNNHRKNNPRGWARREARSGVTF